MKKKLIVIGIILLLIILAFIYCYSKDNIRFKLSYEYINNIPYSNNKKIKVDIPLDNRVKYLDSKEILDFLENGTGILYFGYNSCPWCRNSVPILVNSIVENDISTLYYADIHSKEFNKVYDKVYEKLNLYFKEDDEGNKRLSVPDVYAIKEGSVISHHIGTVSSYHNPYLGMNDSEKQELKDIYNEMIGEIK